MQTKRSIDAGQMPVYMRRAEGVARDWTRAAKCKPGGQHGLPMYAWTVMRQDGVIQGRPAEAWIRLALLVCSSCEAQYDCVRFALAVGEKHGTWGVDLEDLSWLRRRPQVIDVAEDLGTPVQVAVRRAQGAT